MLVKPINSTTHNLGDELSENWFFIQNVYISRRALRVRLKMSGEGQPIQIIGDILCENVSNKISLLLI